MKKIANLKQNGLNFSRRLRRTPFTSSVEKCGVKGFSVVNHTLLPKAFETTIEEDYWHLRSAVQIWDVGVQRQVEIKGTDALKLVQFMTPRSLENMKSGSCYYIPLTDENGGMINDPVLLKHTNNHFWLSIADSDVLLWAKGLAIGLKLDVFISEPDVWPLAIQGPLATSLLVDVFGSRIEELKFFHFSHFEFEGTSQVIARSGYSQSSGFEIYLKGFEHGKKLWDVIWNAGKKYNISPGCPNLIDRIEAGLLSFGNEMTNQTSPLETGLEKYCHLNSSHDFIGKKALKRQKAKGINRCIKGVIFDGPPCPPCAEPWNLYSKNGISIGSITSAVFSPRLTKNIGLGIIAKQCWEQGTEIKIAVPGQLLSRGKVSDLPFK